MFAAGLFLEGTQTVLWDYTANETSRAAASFFSQAANGDVTPITSACHWPVGAANEAKKKLTIKWGGGGISLLSISAV